VEQTLDDYKTKKMLKESIDPERIRGTINEMIKQKIEEQKQPQ
jgi:uncharacterized membrane-anchored protein